MKKKEFVLNLLYCILPMVLVIPLSIWGLSQMNKASYDCFFVVGPSMQPTLNGDANYSTYGYSDNSEVAVNNLKRFDLVICYYPFKGSTDYKQPYTHESPLLDTKTLKVKRVIGLPGDSLEINNETFSISYKVNGETVTDKYAEEEDKENNVKKVPFSRKGAADNMIENRVAQISLGEGEYFVMGDNWTKNGSLDCCNPTIESSLVETTPQCIYKENIAGVIFKLSGTCKYKKMYHCKDCKKIIEDGSSKCSCGGTEFLLYDDIYDEVPYEDGPVYLK